MVLMRTTNYEHKKLAELTWSKDINRLQKLIVDAHFFNTRKSESVYDLNLSCYN